MRAGEGGDDSKLFAADLVNMYRKYCVKRGHQMELVYASPSGIGVREQIFRVSGEGAYKDLLPEAGGHRVQRVPPTERKDKRQTSTVTVVVLRDEEVASVEIGDDDVEFQATTSSAPGGMNVNKVATAVRLRHKKSGKTVLAQDSRTQAANRKSALKRLRAELTEDVKAEFAVRMRGLRRSQIGMGMRGEKMRTYNFRRNLVTDHRTGITVHSTSKIMNGELELLR